MTKALIIGGGVAGAAASIALHKAGIGSVVFEAYPKSAGAAGAFITVMNNGMSALHAIDMSRPIIDGSFPAKGVEYFDPSGRRLGGHAYRQCADTQDWPRTLTRGMLHQLLHEELEKRGIAVEYGKRLSTTEMASNGLVTACFDDGDRASGDLLIGADGLNSATRTVIDPGATTPRYIGLNILYGYAQSERAFGLPPCFYRMVYGKRAFFGCVAKSDSTVWWFARLPGKELDRSAIKEPAHRWREYAIPFFAKDDSLAVDIIAASDEIEVINGYDVPPVRRWSNARMVLIGDAVHAASPALGQGASMAFEDSVVLAKCLRDLSDLPAAFGTYESLRRQRVERVVGLSARQDPANPRWRPILRRLHERRLIKAYSRPSHPQNWLFDYRLSWASPIADRAG